MSIAALPFLDPTRVPNLIPLPRELAELLDEHAAARLEFERLAERDRRSFAMYVAEAKLPQIRERRAALVAMRLASLAGA